MNWIATARKSMKNIMQKCLCKSLIFGPPLDRKSSLHLLCKQTSSFFGGTHLKSTETFWKLFTSRSEPFGRLHPCHCRSHVPGEPHISPWSWSHHWRARPACSLLYNWAILVLSSFSFQPTSLSHYLLSCPSLAKKWLIAPLATSKEIFQHLAFCSVSSTKYLAKRNLDHHTNAINAHVGPHLFIHFSR